jgi:hypothetical protein
MQTETQSQLQTESQTQQPQPQHDLQQFHNILKNYMNDISKDTNPYSKMMNSIQIFRYIRENIDWAYDAMIGDIQGLGDMKILGESVINHLLLVIYDRSVYFEKEIHQSNQTKSSNPTNPPNTHYTELKQEFAREITSIQIKLAPIIQKMNIYHLQQFDKMCQKNATMLFIRILQHMVQNHPNLISINENECSFIPILTKNNHNT